LDNCVFDLIEKTRQVSSFADMYRRILATHDPIEKRLMEVMQILCAVRLDAPHIWEKLDKSNVRKFAQTA
jgi:hypothetical protein